MNSTYIRVTSKVAVIAAIVTGAYFVGHNDAMTGVSFWSPSTASARQTVKPTASPVEPLAERDVYYPGTEAIGPAGYTGTVRFEISSS